MTDSVIGPVRLTVSDLEKLSDFYTDIIGFQLHRQEANVAYLGVGEEDLLVLVEDTSAPRVRRTTGLYHFAILTPSRLALAHSLQRLIETKTVLQGFADHAVSEAIYLADPDGNGIEIYRDRPRNEWRYRDGVIQMTTDPIDIDGILAELDGGYQWQGLHAGTIIGHIHLHVNSLDLAHHFYCDLLGFDEVTRYGPSALFISFEGYHHHIGLNTWVGEGAPPPPLGAQGLRDYGIRMPDQARLDAAVARLQAEGIPLEERETGYALRDAAQNGIFLYKTPLKP
jgi:catechol 2,3-dioxygenase